MVECREISRQNNANLKLFTLEHDNLNATIVYYKYPTCNKSKTTNKNSKIKYLYIKNVKSFTHKFLLIYLI